MGAAAQPKRPRHGPMRRRIAVVRHQALACRDVGALSFLRTIRPALECALPMREGQTGIIVPPDGQMFAILLRKFMLPDINSCTVAQLIVDRLKVRLDVYYVARCKRII